ncbi:TetR family transcriptional regulator [Sneathiella chinensis]|uniref:TetR family transcriptional regulator n=1 Tax=Sneathiella chinensis TaxID=349750 RepID=A0ABQ5U4U8_9PROT|nr:TetR/AcrR family transcriptional regulator [Sneathiella chinensis]GLQ07132.1 TetR family transcriptional regulator [Sneathiella chinensis]
MKLSVTHKSDGVKPALQERSRQRRNDLIDAGMRLLCEKNIADISIIELTAACGYSVGTFYSRFEDKESFFRAVQTTAVDRMLHLIEEGFQGEHWKKAPPRKVFERLVDYTIEMLNSELSGVVKESLVASRTDKELWYPIRDCGRRMGDIVSDLLQDRFLKDNPRESRDSILFGMQMFFGTLIQAILNDPGPIKLEDPRMRKNLTRMLTLYTKLEPSPHTT